ncbi:hypothetical protein GCM10023183_18250 [Nibribacter koreensis]|uniref:Uncharacterized protein n=2 Tax=Nibribacter koreensis TaxID=1084519 RepID=A0ABP8FIV4_9BACT
MKEVSINQKLKGKVFLATGQTIEGTITIYHQLDLVRVKLADSTEAAFAPIAVQFIQGIDQHDGYPRLFKVLPYGYRMGNDYRSMPTYFEEIVPGTYALLLRRNSRTVYSKPVEVPASFIGFELNGKTTNPKHQDQMIYKFFLQVKGQDIMALEKPRKDLTSLYGVHANEMRRFIKLHELDYEDPNHLIRIVEHLNSLVK